MTTTLKLSDVVPTTEGPEVTGLTLDAFRAHMKRDESAPKPFKIGFQNFYRRAELVKWSRDRARKTKV